MSDAVIAELPFESLSLSATVNEVRISGFKIDLLEIVVD